MWPAKVGVVAPRRNEVRSLLSFGRHGGIPAIGRVDDQRRALRSYDLVAAVPPELVVGGSPGNSPAPAGPPWGDTAFRTERGITWLMGLAARFEVLRVAILPAVFAAFPGRRFLIGGEKLLRSQFEGALHRRDGAVVPHALQVRMAIRQPRHSPGLLGGGCRRQQRGCDHNGKTSHRGDKLTFH